MNGLSPKESAPSWQRAKDTGYTYRQIAEDTALNPDARTQKAITRACERFRQSQVDLVQSLPEFHKPGYETPVIETDDAIITSDWEIPDMHNTMARLSMALGQRYHIDYKVIAGDLVASDETGLATHIETWQDSAGQSYEDTIRLTKAMLRQLSMQFDKGIWILEGNHDDRVARATGGQVHLGMFLDEMPVTYLRYYDLWIKTSRGYVYVIHPRTYRANSLGLVEAFWKIAVAPDGNKPIAVVMGHTHQAKSGFSPDGKCRLYALGCVRDPRLTKYIHQGGRPYPAWINSILMIRKGHFYPIDLESDFDFWLGPHAEGVRQGG